MYWKEQNWIETWVECSADRGKEEEISYLEQSHSVIDFVLLKQERRRSCEDYQTKEAQT
jgi:hypothetical protein